MAKQPKKKTLRKNQPAVKEQNFLELFTITDKTQAIAYLYTIIQHDPLARFFFVALLKELYKKEGKHVSKRSQ